jgi:hypothetical protein
MWYPNTIGIPQINRMKKIELYKKLAACRKAPKSPLTSMVMDARIASITKELAELSDRKRVRR